MISHEVQPGIVSVELDRKEYTLIMNEAEDIRPSLAGFTEVTLLDTLHESGKALREKVTEVADFLEDMSDHKGVKVAVFDLGTESVKDIGPTPTKYVTMDDGQNLFFPDVYRGLLVSLAGLYGYGFTTQQGGVVHNNIIPIEEHAETTGHSGNAKYELGLHVEDASFNLGQGNDISPDFLTLHFYRNNAQIPTVLSMPDWDTISTGTRDLLSEEWYFNKTNPLQGGEKNDPIKPVAVIYGPGDDPWIRLNTSRLNLESYDPNQQRALIEFTDHVNDRKTNIYARAGQIVVFDNRRVLHGRAPYSAEDYPKYDGNDRWQRRLTVSCDMSRIQEFEASRRVVDPIKLLAKTSY